MIIMANSKLYHKFDLSFKRLPLIRDVLIYLDDISKLTSCKPF